VSFLVLLGATFATVLFVIEAVIGRGLETASFVTLQETASKASDRVNQELHERLRDVLILSEVLSGLSDPSHGKGKSLIAAFSNSYPEYSWVAITDAEGIVKLATRGMLEGQSVAKRPWFPAGLKGPYVGDVHDAVLLGKLLGEPPANQPWRFVDFAAPITDGAGRTVGVLGTHLNWTWAGDILRPFESHPETGHGRNVFIVDKMGVVLHGPVELRGTKLDIPDSQNGTATWKIGSQWVLAAAPADKYLSWTIVVRDSLDDVLLPVQQMRRAVMLSILPLLAFFLIVAFVMARRLSAPLEALSDAASHGAFLLEVRGYLEVERLNAALRDMVARLLDQKAEVEAEVKLRTAEIGYLTEAQEAHAIVSMGDEHGNITYVNDKFCDISGYNRRELLGKNHRLIKSDVHSQEFYVDMWRTISSGQIWQGTICNRSKGGDKYWVQSTIVPIREATDTPHRYISIRTDVTRIVNDQENLKHLGDNLRRKNELVDFLHRFSSAANKAHNGDEALRMALISICAFSGVQVGIVFFVDPNDQARLLPSPYHYSLDPKRFENFIKTTMGRTPILDGGGVSGRALAEKTAQWCFDIAQEAPNCQASLAGLHGCVAIPVVVGNNVMAVLEFLSDAAIDENAPFLQFMDQISVQLGFVFERELTAGELLASREQADKANLAKSEFLSSMSHELRTPLNAILGFAQILEGTQKNPLTDRQKDHVQQILKGGYHLLDLINEVLDLAAIESGRLSMSVETIDLRPLVDECLGVIQGQANKRGITLSG
jgi:PAS domain S-box-containing protein